LLINTKKQVVGYCVAGDVVNYPIEFLERIRREGLKALKEQGFKVTEFSEFVSDFNRAHALIHLFKKEMVDVVILNFASWVEGGIVLRIFNRLRHIPFILWGFGNFNQTLTLTGLVEATSNLVKTGKKFSVVLGPPSSPFTQKQISTSVNIFSTIESLESANIGMIGYNCPGMIDATVDEIALRRKIGCELVHLDLLELIQICKSISNERVNEAASKLKSSVKNISANKKDLLASVRLYLALKKMVTSYGLDGFAIRCWPELKNNWFQLHMTPCYAISQLAEEGIVGACEADISSTVTMFLLKGLTGNPPVVLDYNTFDISKNSIALWHCGANAFGLAESKDSIELKKPTSGGLKELNSGMSVEFSVREGKATLAKLTREYDKMLISSGNFVSPSPKFRGGIAELTLDIPVSEFFNTIVEEGFEHHICIAHGDVKEELLKICKFLKIEPVVLV